VFSCQVFRFCDFGKMLNEEMQSLGDGRCGWGKDKKSEDALGTRLDSPESQGTRDNTRTRKTEINLPSKLQTPPLIRLFPSQNILRWKIGISTDPRPGAFLRFGF